MTSEVTQQIAITSDHTDILHPDFRSPSGDFTITSSDGVRFRVHRFLLQESSPVFSDMLMVPQPEPGPDAHLSLPSVSLPEDSEIITALLRLTYPVPPPSFTDLDIISKVISAAQKYEMGNAITSLRRIFIEGKFLERDPMTAYAMARRLGWNYEAHLASFETLKFDLFAPANLALLSTPGFPSEDVAQLFSLRHNRIKKMRLLYPTLEVGDCGNCGKYGESTPEGAWLRLKMLILDEMERRPLGDGILCVDFINRDDIKTSCATKCSRCNTRCFDRVNVFTRIKDVLNKLPACACHPCDFTSDSTKENLKKNVPRRYYLI